MTGMLIGVVAIMFGIICTTAYLDWYYTSAAIENMAGVTVLHKKYGILQPINLIYVIVYFIAMIAVPAALLKQCKCASQKYACILY